MLDKDLEKEKKQEAYIYRMCPELEQSRIGECLGDYHTACHSTMTPIDFLQPILSKTNCLLPPASHQGEKKKKSVRQREREMERMKVNKLRRKAM